MDSFSPKYNFQPLILLLSPEQREEKRERARRALEAARKCRGKQSIDDRQLGQQRRHQQNIMR